MEAIKIGSPSKMDFKKQFKELYHPPVDEAVVIDVPAMNFLMIDGQGDPNIAQEYKDAVEALYSVSYTLKFNLKKISALTRKKVPRWRNYIILLRKTGTNSGQNTTKSTLAIPAKHLRRS